jgi:uncharacterized protein GlcG (DUF336 family)
MTDITLAQASNIIDATLAAARERDTAPMAAIVLDKGGNLVAFKREDGASILRFDIARGKAWGAIGMLMSSRKMAEMAEARPTFVTALGEMSGGRVVPSPGGLLIESEHGEVIGSVGVSGDLPDLDERCAIAGIKFAKLNFRA